MRRGSGLNILHPSSTCVRFCKPWITSPGRRRVRQLPVVDMQGRRVATEPETRYSISHRLTSGVLPVVAVQLPAKPSAFMLARTLAVEGVPYRMDLSGGSKLKAQKPTLSQIAATGPGEPGPYNSRGKAPGDTLFRNRSRHRVRAAIPRLGPAQRGILLHSAQSVRGATCTQ